MSAHRLVADVLVFAGVAVCVAAAVGALLPRGPLDRIHFLAPVTSLGTPLIGVGLAVSSPWHLSTAIILVTTGVLAVTGPVLATAAARVAGQRQGLVSDEGPE